MMTQNLRTVLGAFAVGTIAVLTASAAGAQAGKAGFDGSWSVLIVTEKGDCDRAYRYPIRISGGTLENAGSASFDISGKVANNGAITVKVSHGSKSASGSGRLSATDGFGSWSGGSCAGTWQAERRG
jgi:hypothetical protein